MHTTRWFVLALALTAGSNLAPAQSLVDQFEKRTFTSDSLTLPYRLFVPEDYDPEVQYPLVLTLHGRGDQGSDNESHIASSRLATSWADPLNQARWPAFVMAPQIPQGYDFRIWLDLDNTSVFGPRRDTYTVMATLDSLEREFNIDPDRIYVTGLSMGGTGTWALTTLDPDRFAAAIPMSASFFPAYAEAGRYDHVPIWLFHGEEDPGTEVEGPRRMIAAFKDRDRTTLFTDCRFDPTACDPISEEAFDSAMATHPDLIYTGYPGAGHDVWNMSYDDPRLQPWVFSQHRILRDGIQITSPVGYPTWSGSMDVTWSETDESETGELWLSIDNGDTWTLVDSMLSNTGTVTIDTELFEDTPVARIRLLFRDADGFIHKRETSERFAIDNLENGPPFVQLARLPFVGHPVIEDDVLELKLLAADPEGQTMEARILFSTDGGTNFSEMQTLELQSSASYQSIDVDLSALPNTDEAVLMVLVSDLNYGAEEATLPFEKRSNRLSTSYVEHVTGKGVASIAVKWVDPSALTGHRYRITFNYGRPSATAYNVMDMETGMIVLEDVPVSDGIVEGPAADGIRLIVEVPTRATVNLDSTRWYGSGTDMVVSISAPTINTPQGRTQLSAWPADYDITLYDEYVDTSFAELGIPAVPMRFKVTDDTGAEPSVLFIDKGNDGSPSIGDALYILEPATSKGFSAGPALAWLVSFGGDASTVLPVAGDVLHIRTNKPATEQDVFEFEAAVGVGVEDEIPAQISGLANYPNPFRVATNIQYDLAEPSTVTLEVFDILGRRVDHRDEGFFTSGRTEVDWRIDSNGTSLPSGLYLYRLTAQTVDGRSSEALGRMVVVR